jgi:hypothetical protein
MHAMADVVRIVIFDGEGRPALFQDTGDLRYAAEVMHEAQSLGLNAMLIPEPSDPVTVEEVSDGLAEREERGAPAGDDQPAALRVDGPPADAAGPADRECLPSREPRGVLL